MSRKRALAAAIVCGVVTGGLHGYAGGQMAQAQQTQSQTAPLDRTVTVSGFGYVEVEPDTVHITVGVMSEGETAKVALEKNSAAMNGIVQTLKGRGVEAKDIQTSNFSVHPRYRQIKSGDQPQINGYQVQNTVRIVVRNIAALGNILDQVVQAGSNQIHSIIFEASKADSLRDDARKAAVANARHKAALLATAAGAGIGRVLAIEELGVPTIQRHPRVMMGRAASSMESAPPPIEAGSQRLEAHVTVTFALD